ncbi:hypothetical protein A2120_01485 [Candidatus Giovannonibacteria bacterium GWA2_45_15]|nr:MAG: hypothetical protein A2120_01485 [Candidatus Giovannonibacteria bacterium GWA2_45_15]
MLLKKTPAWNIPRGGFRVILCDMGNPQRKFVVLLFPALIVAMLIGGGAYVYVQNNQANQSVVTTTKTINSQTADWKTYSNTQFDFSFKYPPDWSFSGEVGSNLKPYKPPYIFGSLFQKNLSIIHVDVLDMPMDSFLEMLAAQNPTAFKSVTDFSSSGFLGKKFIGEENTPTYIHLLDLRGKIIKIEPALVGSQQSSRSNELIDADAIAQMIAKTFSTGGL